MVETGRDHRIQNDQGNWDKYKFRLQCKQTCEPELQRQQRKRGIFNEICKVI